MTNSIKSRQPSIEMERIQPKSDSRPESPAKEEASGSTAIPAESKVSAAKTKNRMNADQGKILRTVLKRAEKLVLEETKKSGKPIVTEKDRDEVLERVASRLAQRKKEARGMLRNKVMEILAETNKRDEVMVTGEGKDDVLRSIKDSAKTEDLQTVEQRLLSIPQENKGSRRSFDMGDAALTIATHVKNDGIEEAGKNKTDKEKEEYLSRIGMNPPKKSEIRALRQNNAPWANWHLENMKVEKAGEQPFVEVPTMDHPKSASRTHKWPALICSFTIDKTTGELKWAGDGVDTKRRRKKDAKALAGLFAELNKSPEFKAKMQELAKSHPANTRFEIKYKMGEEMDELFNHFKSKFMMEKAFLWKNADVARQRHREAAKKGTPVQVQEDDYVILDLTNGGKSPGKSVMSAALAGMERQQKNWDENTKSDDFSRLESVLANVTVRVPTKKAKEKSTGTTEVADEIQTAITDELRTDSHKEFRARQAGSHARYQAGIIDYSWGGLAGSMLGGGVYSLGMMLLNNKLNRNMIPDEEKKKHGLDQQSAVKKIFGDVTEELKPIANSLQKFWMTFNPSWQLGTWEIFDNAILDAVLGDDDDDDDDAGEGSDAASVASSTKTEDDWDDKSFWKDTVWESIKEKASSTHTAVSELTAEKVWNGVKETPEKTWNGVKSGAAAVGSGAMSVATGAPKLAGQMVASAPFAVPAGLISGVASWPDKAIELWEPSSIGGKIGKGVTKVLGTAPVSSEACSSGFFLKMGETAAEREATVLSALSSGLLAWPEKNPFDSTKPFDRSNQSQVSRAIYDMTQDQLNNDPDPLAIRLSVPWEFISGAVQGGLSFIPGMTETISFALETVFFGPGEMLWMTINGFFANHENEKQLRAALADVQKHCDENNFSVPQKQWAAIQFLLKHELISEQALEQWMSQLTSMLGGAAIHQVYERSSDVKNLGRMGARGAIDTSVSLAEKFGSAMPEKVQAVGKKAGDLAGSAVDVTGDGLGWALDETMERGYQVAQGILKYWSILTSGDYEPDKGAAKEKSDAVKEMLKNGAKLAAGVITPGQNDMRIRARLPYPMVVASAAESEAQSIDEDLAVEAQDDEMPNIKIQNVDAQEGEVTQSLSINTPAEAKKGQRLSLEERLRKAVQDTPPPRAGGIFIK